MSQSSNSAVGDGIMEVINETINATNATLDKFQPTLADNAVAYLSLLIMALVPIIVGSFKSVNHQKKQQDSGEAIETMSTKEALMFPVIASGTLFGIYVIFQIFSKEYINLLLAFYFFVLGVIALTRTFHPVLVKLLRHKYFEEQYDLKFSLKTVKEKKEILVHDEIIDKQFIIAFFASLALGVWYIMKKHWIANNLFGIAFSINGIEFLQLNKIQNGCILLAGLFFYDIFWVFGTNVMVTVAKSFEAPIKLTFPQDFLENGVHGEKFALLGLGDIVIPGIFIALLLRFDFSLKRDSKIYFYSSFIAYVVALMTTIFVMHVFKHAQPALLYIVPLCLIVPLSVALVKGDIRAMFEYVDHEEETKKNNDSTTSTNESTTSNDDDKKKTK